MKLYELTGSFNEIFEALETEEELNYQALEDTLQAIEGAIEQKADGIAKVVKSLEKTAEAYSSEAKRLSEKAKSTSNKIDWLKDYLLRAMEATAKQKIPTDIGTVYKWKSPPSVNVLSEDAIPRKYWIIPPPPAPQLDKKMIIADLKADVGVPGTEIHQGYHIRIQ